MATAQIKHRQMPMLDLGVNKQQPPSSSTTTTTTHDAHPSSPHHRHCPPPTTTWTHWSTIRTMQEHHVSHRQVNGRQ